ncbi:MAG: hypothetical protein ABIY62_05890 [Ginsengibacter sp.]
MKSRIFRLIPGFICGMMLFISSCTKDYSYEGGRTLLPTAGTLQDSAGNCKAIIVNGSYQANIPVNNNNYITVQLDITNPGSYNIYTDTVNGFYFRAAGIDTNTGIQSVTLKAYGKPMLPIENDFIVHFNQSVCNFTIMPASPTVSFSGNCDSTIVNGNYITATQLNASDTVNILVNVTIPGAFKVQTANINGMTFSANGNFSAIGKQRITLVGSGMPLSKGISIIPIQIGTTVCSFLVNVNDSITHDNFYWQYTTSGVVHKGVLDSAILGIGKNMLYPANTIYEFEAYGKPDGDPGLAITFQIDLYRINHVLSTGSYTPGILGSRDFVGYVGHFDHTGNLSAADSLPSFTILVTNFDITSRIVEGTFSGPVIDDFGQMHTMNDGSFRTYIKN